MPTAWTGAHGLEPLESAAAEEIAGGCPLADQLKLEHLADDAREVADADGPADAEQLARAADCEVHERRDCPVDGFVFDPRDPAHPRRRIIVVRSRRDRCRVVLAILHELAHVLLDRACPVHSHADVWCLTLALALPLRALRRMQRHAPLDAATLAVIATIPVWAVRIRLEMGAVSNAA